MIHQLSESSAFRESDSRPPQDTSATGSPSPIKLKVASVIMAAPMLLTAAYSTAGRKPGSRCFRRMYPKLPPIIRAAVT